MIRRNGAVIFLYELFNLLTFLFVNIFAVNAEVNFVIFGIGNRLIYYTAAVYSALYRFGAYVFAV